MHRKEELKLEELKKYHPEYQRKHPLQTHKKKPAHTNLAIGKAISTTALMISMYGSNNESVAHKEAQLNNEKKISEIIGKHSPAPRKNTQSDLLPTKKSTTYNKHQPQLHQPRANNNHKQHHIPVKNVRPSY